jgi:hypothetical protein
VQQKDKGQALLNAAAAAVLSPHLSTKREYTTVYLIQQEAAAAALLRCSLNFTLLVTRHHASSHSFALSL